MVATRHRTQFWVASIDSTPQHNCDDSRLFRTPETRVFEVQRIQCQPRPEQNTGVRIAIACRALAIARFCNSATSPNDVCKHIGVTTIEHPNDVGVPS
eukprot:9919383-Alexandrium_andersonii.AAC.1